MDTVKIKDGKLDYSGDENLKQVELELEQMEKEDKLRNLSVADVKNLVKSLIEKFITKK